MTIPTIEARLDECHEKMALASLDKLEAWRLAWHRKAAWLRELARRKKLEAKSQQKLEDVRGMP